MIPLGPTTRLSFLLFIFVLIPALFLGFYSISLLESGGAGSVGRYELLVNAAIIFLCTIAIIAGGVFSTSLMRKEMELLNLKDEFISRISHELKTPLATIKLLAEMLDAGVQRDEKRQEYYKTISQESERLDRLVTNILNFSRITSGRLPFEPQLCSVDELVNAVLRTLALGDTGFEFEFQNMSESEEIYCSPDELSQALLNLLENAVKYSAAPHTIRIILQTTEEDYRLSVWDRGLGIALQYHTAIFEQFYRVSSPATLRKKGTGIGLSVVAAIMRMHKGRVELESQEGKGSRFTLVFPKPPSSHTAVS